MRCPWQRKHIAEFRLVRRRDCLPCYFQRRHEDKRPVWRVRQKTVNSISLSRLSRKKDVMGNWRLQRILLPKCNFLFLKNSKFSENFCQNPERCLFSPFENEAILALCNCVTAVNLFYTVFRKKHPLTFSSISPWLVCRFKQKLQWIYIRNGRFWSCRN